MSGTQGQLLAGTGIAAGRAENQRLCVKIIELLHTELQRSGHRPGGDGRRRCGGGDRIDNLDAGRRDGDVAAQPLHGDRLAGGIGARETAAREIDGTGCTVQGETVAGRQQQLAGVGRQARRRRAGGCRGAAEEGIRISTRVLRQRVHRRVGGHVHRGGETVEGGGAGDAEPARDDVRSIGLRDGRTCDDAAVRLDDRHGERARQQRVVRGQQRVGAGGKTGDAGQVNGLIRSDRGALRILRVDGRERGPKSRHDGVGEHGGARRTSGVREAGLIEHVDRPALAGDELVRVQIAAARKIDLSVHRHRRTIQADLLRGRRRYDVGHDRGR